MPVYRDITHDSSTGASARAATPNEFANAIWRGHGDYPVKVSGPDAHGIYHVRSGWSDLVLGRFRQVKD